MVTGGVLSSPSASYEKHTMPAIPESSSIMPSTALRKNFVRNGFISYYRIATEHFGDESFCSMQIKAALSVN